MESFGSIEELFVNPTEEKKSDGIYDPWICDSGWFLKSDSELKAKYNYLFIKYQADYIYSFKMFPQAINLYKEYMECENLSSTVILECIEGIARSYLGMKCFCHALKYAKKFQSMSSNLSTHTRSLSLFYDLFLKIGRSKDTVLYGQKLVTLHSSNIDMWFKLGSGYYGYFKYDDGMPNLKTFEDILYKKHGCFCSAYLHNIPCTCTDLIEFSDPNDLLLNNENGLLIILICLLYVEFHLKSVANSTSGISVERNRNLKKKIEKDLIYFQNNEFENEIEFHRQFIKEKYTGLKFSKEESVDKDSSKFLSNEEVNSALQFGELDFHKIWFKLDT